MKQLLLAAILAFATTAAHGEDTQPLRVFIFAGQSNMVGTHSKVVDIQRFPPFAGLDQPQKEVLFSYMLGREQMKTSEGWIEMQPTGDYFGPELSFARKVAQSTQARIAIIKVASGGTTLGKDWNPDMPDGFKLYPLALEHIRASLAELEKKKVAYRIEGFMWHQGENDMFDHAFKPIYADNLKNFIACWRRDLKTPQMKFYIGELCTKTVWGMDNRENMLAIRTAQKAVAAADPLTEYIPTSHDAVEIGGDAGLHYHYGTLGQLEHGVNYADAYLRTLGIKTNTDRPLKIWPYAKGSAVKLFILAGHRNMEGERAFKQELGALAAGDPKIAFKYQLGGGFKKSNEWEPLGAAGFYDTVGPELSFAKTLQGQGNIAIAKFTHSGTQMNDWTPEGTAAKDMHVYGSFITFIRGAVQELKDKRHAVELAGIFYHAGENDMAYGPYRKQAAKWLQSTVKQSRVDLGMPSLKWYVSQQTPADHKGLSSLDITSDIAAIAAADPAFVHVKAFELPAQREKLVLDTAGVVKLGEVLAQAYLQVPVSSAVPPTLKVQEAEVQEAEMAGYLFGPAERVAEEFNGGFSLYAAAWPLVGTYPGHKFQTGLCGTWMHPQWSEAEKPKEKCYTDIEGGLGWWRDTHFPTTTPKFIMGGVGPNFSFIANGPGYGAGTWEKPRGQYGVAQLSPWLLFPLDGLNLKQGTSGELFGYGYLPLPLTDAKKITAGKNVPTGNHCWTLFLNTANFKGPATFFTPFFWSQATVDHPEWAGLLLDSKPAGPNKAIQMETQHVPAILNGHHARVAPTSFPVGADGTSTVLHRLTAYQKAALWDDVQKWFAGGAPASGEIKPDAAAVHTFREGGGSNWSIYPPGTKREEKVPLDWKSFATSFTPNPITFGYRWNTDLTRTSSGLVTLPEYYALSTDSKKPRWNMMSPNEAPADLTQHRFVTPAEKPQEPRITPDAAESCWKKPGPKAGPFKAKLGDGSVVTYYWYRFADQPAMLNADLTDAEREVVQARVEKLHRTWTKDRNYLTPPDVGTLASIDPALILTPPPGLEIGYVPIATRQELE
jgi:Carbohydrate esterase, sialic acid-specific acetylesterase